ncbi:hypothetical protein J7L67_01995 [bacterium]|nr:hypothetical protein [bacterium]
MKTLKKDEFKKVVELMVKLDPTFEYLELRKVDTVGVEDNEALEIWLNYNPVGLDDIVLEQIEIEIQDFTKTNEECWFFNHFLLKRVDIGTDIVKARVSLDKVYQRYLNWFDDVLVIHAKTAAGAPLDEELEMVDGNEKNCEAIPFNMEEREPEGDSVDPEGDGGDGEGDQMSFNEEYDEDILDELKIIDKMFDEAEKDLGFEDMPELSELDIIARKISITKSRVETLNRVLKIYQNKANELFPHDENHRKEIVYNGFKTKHVHHSEYTEVKVEKIK